MAISIDRVFERISCLVSGLGYFKHSKEFDKTVKEITQSVPIKEIPELIKRLEGLKKKTKDDFTRERNRVVSQAQNEGMLRFGGLPEHMVDYYDNEASAAHVRMIEKKEKINWVIMDLLNRLTKRR